ncbi:glycosyltransferase family 4 protein [Cohnella faecalis]|uniref:Glycosyltransferase n=1 Tax=Cohnella faecalis TaxID=2315694 RepID=A0A398CSS3_9BACL|nr:glycosyltransferase [Cohnella faecalis]RIE03808.1 glycosyltransferase [Cohnella faecalis]
MRIGFYNHTSVVSGAEISMLLTAKNLKNAEPVVFAPEGELGDRARVSGVAFEPISGYRARLTKNPFVLVRHLAGMAAEGWRLAKRFKSAEVDIVHANSIRAGLIVSLFGWLHRRPIVWHIRDNPPGGWIGRAIDFIAKRTVKELICISESVKAGMGEELRTLAKVVHNGVELSFATAEEKAKYRRAIREELGASPSARVIAVIGQIAPWKRQMDALIAARLLLDDGCDIQVWIVGEPKFREENEAYAERLRQMASGKEWQGKVVFTGFREDVKEICCAADLLFLCSDNEPFGRVLIESMAQGTPVVATRAGGVPEIVVDGSCGLLYEVGDTEGLARCAGRLLGDEELRASMGREAVLRVKQCFGIDRTAEKVEEAYRRILPEKPFKTAIVHDYLNQMGGAERVVASLRRMFPDAPIYTTIVDRPALLEELKDADIRTTWMQRIPGVLKRFKLYFWLFPFAVRSMDFREYDLIVSSSSAYAKGIKKPRGAVHVCYCHTPMRFAWDFEGYVQGMKIPFLLKWASRLFIVPLRRWDARNSARVDEIVANSTIVKERIRNHYGKDASIVYPPVQLERFGPVEADGGRGPDDYFLVVSRLVSYKKIELAVKACTLLSERLIVVGDGPDRQRLERMAGPTVSFAGRLPDDQVERLMRGCRALLFPGIEDFGITPLEANACGRPVIAFGAGGALDTVDPGLNGLFFDSQTPESLAGTLRRFALHEWNPALIRRHAESFGERRFETELRSLIGSALQARGKRLFAASTAAPATGASMTANTTTKEVTA